MDFPPANCPDCGEPGYNITSLQDERFHYLCVNPACPTKSEFDGDVIPLEHKAEGRARLARTLADCAPAFETGEPWEDEHGNML